MPHTQAICRMCLKVDKNMFTIVGTPLQTVYEKISNILLCAEKRPIAACVCNSQLNRCYKVMTNCITVEYVLTQILEKETAITLSSLCDSSSKGLLKSLTTSPMSVLDIPPTESEYQLVVKIEQEEIQDMKEELQEPAQTEYITASRISNETNVFEDVFIPLECIGVNIPQKQQYIGIPVAVPTQHKSKKEKRKNSHKQHSCDTCNAMFAHKRGLTRHILNIHTGEKPFECGICCRKFSQKQTLQKHHRLHTGEKPFECQYCDRRFNQKAHLDRHILSHTGGQMYECIICSRKFPVKHDLSRHMKIHTGERPFACKVCDRKFNQKSHLDRHAKVHSGERPHECLNCHKRFTERYKLKLHLNKCKSIDAGQP